MSKFLLTTVSLFISIFIYAQSPTFEWAKNMGGYFGTANAYAVTVDAASNIYTTGTFSGKVDFDPGPGTSFLTSIGNIDAFVSKKDVSGNLLWVKQIGGYALGSSIAVSTNGNIIIAGSFTYTTDFDPGANTFNLTSAGYNDFFICMLNTLGGFVWARSIGSTADDVANAITLDGFNNVYVTGNFSGNVDFDPGAGTYNLNAGTNYSNAFILKLNAGGNFEFAKHITGNSAFGISIAVDLSGSIYTSGNFFNTVDLDPGAGIFNLISSGNTDIFILKLNSLGDFVWAKQLGGIDSDNVRSIKSDAIGNVYTTGIFRGVGEFDPGPGVMNLTSAGLADVFISKLDFSGNYLWAYRIGENNGDDVFESALDASGNIYLIGYYLGNVDFDPGAGTFYLPVQYSRPIYILKLTASGNFVMVKSFGGTDGFDDASIAVDASENIFTTGRFFNQCDFDPGTGTYNLCAPGNAFMYTSKLDSSGNFLWAHCSGASSSTLPKAMTTDAAGNVYTTGYFIGTVDFDPGPGVLNLSIGATDYQGDIFVTKCNSSGNLLWAKRIGGNSHEYTTSIAVDAAGNVYTAGSFKQTVDFNPGAGTFNLISSTSNYDNFVLKLNSSGNFVWAKKLDVSYSEDIYSIALDPSGNLYTAGRQMSITNSFELYLNKILPNGILVWSKIYGGTDWDEVDAITSDATGNIYITGYFRGTADFDPGPGVFNLTGIGYNNGYVTKLDGLGNFIWAKLINGTGNTYCTAIAVDNSDRVHIAGYFGQTADFDPGSGIYNLTAIDYDAYILKLDNSGNYIWAKQFAGIGYEKISSIAIDDYSNVYTTGTFDETDFDPGPGTFNLISPYYQDVFTSKLDSSGDFMWAHQIGTEEFEYVFSIALDVSSNIYTAGSFRKTVDFDPGVGVFNLTGNGNPNLFIHKMSQCVAPTAIITPSGPTTFCLGESVTLNANTGTGLTYQWKRNGVNINGANSSSYVATTPGNYSVFVSDTQPCTAASINIHVSVPCIPVDPADERIQNDQSIVIYPNPSSGIFTINSPQGEMQIFNAYGQLVYTSLLQDGEKSFDLSDFPDGIYFVKLNTELNLFTKKIIVEH